MKTYIQDFAAINALGHDLPSILQALQQQRSGLSMASGWLPEQRIAIGKVTATLPQIPPKYAAFASRNNQLLMALAQQLAPQIQALKQQYRPERIAVLVGTSTSGCHETETALAAQTKTGAVPTSYHYQQQELSSGAHFLAQYLGISGIHYAISTACSSSAKAFISAQKLLHHGLADAVLVAGADSLCGLTINGFHALASLSTAPAQPFCTGRNGINIGEAAALFILSKAPSALTLVGAGDSSDAHHISAPDPTGKGAQTAMRQALKQANLSPADLGYINLHGTGTLLNDSMESLAVASLGVPIACSSSKQLTGHTLGAAGVTEASLACLLLQHPDTPLPRHDFSIAARDPLLADIALVTEHQTLRQPAVMSNSFAFGGNNVSLIFAKETP